MKTIKGFSLKNIIGKGRAEFSLSYGFIVMLLFFAIGYLLGQINFGLLMTLGVIK